MNDKPMPIGASLRELLVFQVKLAVDALRDLLFSPVSIGIVLLDLVQRNPPGARHFEQLMQVGHRSDVFINLFGTATGSAHSLDTVIDTAEAAVRRPRPPTQD